MKTFKETWEEKRELNLSKAKHESTGKSGEVIDIKRIASDVMADASLKAEKAVMSALKGKKVALRVRLRLCEVEGVVTKVNVGYNRDDPVYLTVTLDDGQEYSGIKNVKVLN